MLPAGVGLRDIGSKAMDFGLQMMGLLEKHYPVSSHPLPLSGPIHAF
jgi:hypothetical protein